MSGIIGGAGSRSGVIGETEIDYEEGFHNPTVTDSGTNGAYGLNASYDTLSYTKIGRVVTVGGTLVFSSVPSRTGTVKITMPFAAADLTEAAGKYSQSFGMHVVDFDNGTAPYIELAEGDSTANLAVSWDNNYAAEAQGTTSTQLFIGFTYITS